MPTATLPPTPPKVLYQGAMPDPDYGNHPAYGNFFSRPSIVERFKAVKAFWPYLKKARKDIRSQGWDRQEATRRLMREARSPLAKDLATDGALGLKVPARDKEAFLKLIQPQLDTLTERRRLIPGEQRTFMDNIQRIQKEEVQPYQQITTILEKMGVLEAAREYLNTPVEVHTLNLMAGDATDTWMHPPYEGLDFPGAPTVYMHMDTVYRMLKCIWYLTPVTMADGPFCYVRGSHRVAISQFENAVRTANYKLFSDRYDIESRRQFWALPGKFRKRANFGDDLMADTPGIQDILAAEHRFTSGDGDLIFFDNSGFHRGSVFEGGSRTVLQILLLPIK